MIILIDSTLMSVMYIGAVTYFEKTESTISTLLVTPITNHELSVSGGNDKSTYSSSISYFSQQGIIGGEKSQFDRITARLNTRHNVTTKFSFGNNLSYSHIKRKGIASNQSFNGNGNQ